VVVCWRNFPVVRDFTNCPASAAAAPHSLGPGGLISTLEYFHTLANRGLAASTTAAKNHNALLSFHSLLKNP